MYRDPLSFSQNTTQDLAESVRYALKQLGCSEELLSGFDSYSTIKMEFDDCKDVHISLENDRLWLWSRFNTKVSDLTHFSQSILELLSRPMLNVETSQPVIGECEDGFEIKALINPRCIDDVNEFSSVIEDFHSVIKSVLS
ncbi:hypothetical protein GCM10007938_35860 [Vibrio zhanjiangensis]|uniref:Uncharacterized protein n=1 Tax=Vibrio zhanjiangensis TaxID=1046128 RepID=A0ABQ6F2T2_9VIBR|nr:hypothetical protein [Vibrio zhanjiangensis]GLT19803.1 hypothetical protein GCM10007938_35860 [Vibrio zhanjiangensis]